MSSISSLSELPELVLINILSRMDAQSVIKMQRVSRMFDRLIHIYSNRLQKVVCDLYVKYNQIESSVAFSIFRFLPVNRGTSCYCTELFLKDKVIQENIEDSEDEQQPFLTYHFTPVYTDHFTEVASVLLDRFLSRSNIADLLITDCPIWLYPILSSSFMRNKTTVQHVSLEDLKPVNSALIIDLLNSIRLSKSVTISLLQQSITEEYLRLPSVRRASCSVSLQVLDSDGLTLSLTDSDLLALKACQLRIDAYCQITNNYLRTIVEEFWESRARIGNGTTGFIIAADTHHFNKEEVFRGIPFDVDHSNAFIIERLDGECLRLEVQSMKYLLSISTKHEEW